MKSVHLLLAPCRIFAVFRTSKRDSKSDVQNKHIAWFCKGPKLFLHYNMHQDTTLIYQKSSKFELFSISQLYFDIEKRRRLDILWFLSFRSRFSISVLFTIPRLFTRPAALCNTLGVSPIGLQFVLFNCSPFFCFQYHFYKMSHHISLNLWFVRVQVAGDWLQHIVVL